MNAPCPPTLRNFLLVAWHLEESGIRRGQRKWRRGRRRGWRRRKGEREFDIQDTWDKERKYREEVAPMWKAPAPAMILLSLHMPVGAPHEDGEGLLVDVLLELFSPHS